MDMPVYFHANTSQSFLWFRIYNLVRMSLYMFFQRYKADFIVAQGSGQVEVILDGYCLHLNRRGGIVKEKFTFFRSKVIPVIEFSPAVQDIPVNQIDLLFTKQIVA